MQTCKFRIKEGNDDRALWAETRIQMLRDCQIIKHTLSSAGTPTSLISDCFNQVKANKMLVKKTS